jgi:hypothetical protein
MGFNEQTDREGIVGSCRDLMRFQAMFSRHFAHSPIDRFGEEGAQAMRTALRRYGAYRAGVTRRNVRTAGVALTAASAIEHWDMADFHLMSELVPGSIAGTDQSVSVTLQHCAEWERWEEYPESLSIARLYYGCVFPAIAEGLDLEVEFDASLLDLESPWTVTWKSSGPPAGGAPAGPSRTIHSRIFENHGASLVLTRRTAMNNGAIYYFCADEETKRFDMVGESALRNHCQQLGIERARRQKAAHLAAGWELNLETLMENWDGQLVSLWQFAPGVLTKGVWHQDCSVCPYADVWGEFGRRAMDLGYLYDKEMHSTYYQEYHPDMRVQFSSIKTRGDRVCGFRVSMPSKMLPGDPQFEGYTGRDI